MQTAAQSPSLTGAMELDSQKCVIKVPLPPNSDLIPPLVDEHSKAFRLVTLAELSHNGAISPSLQKKFAGARFLRIQSQKSENGMFEVIWVIPFPKGGSKDLSGRDQIFNILSCAVIVKLIALDKLQVTPSYVEVLEGNATATGLRFQEPSTTTFKLTSSNGTCVIEQLGLPKILDGEQVFDNKELEITLEYKKFGAKRFPMDQLPNNVYKDINVADPTLTLLDLQNLGQALPLSKPFIESIPSLRLKEAILPFFEDLAKFGTLLKETGSLVTSSVVLSVLNPGQGWQPGDLDVVVPMLARRVIQGFLESQNYRHEIPPEDEEAYPSAGFAIEGFERMSFRRGECKVDVLVPHTLSPVDFILSFHSSVVMNYFDGDQIVCLLPHLTFNNLLKRTESTMAYGPEHKQLQDAAVAKYVSKRGFTKLEDTLEGEFDKVIFDDGNAVRGGRWGPEASPVLKIGNLRCKTWRVTARL